MRRRLIAAALLAASLVVAWGMAELTLFLLLAHPAWLPHLPATLRRNLVTLYLDLDRPIIQWDLARAQFDPRLLYTLKPGRFDYTAREFATRFYVNRLGVRDDEESLIAPEIVVVGDSFAMGWGVQQEETFAQVIERRTGRRVLDTAVSSYGTVREMRMLERVDLTRATHVILQYSQNDADENVPFLDGVDHASYEPIEFTDMLKWAQRVRRYWPGRYTWWFIDGWIERRADAGPPSQEAPLSRQVEALLAALERASPNVMPARTRLVFIAADCPPVFVDELERALAARRDLPAWIRDMKVVRLPLVETYALDGHWTAAGHRRVADALLPWLR
jgi:hypothetical protein